MVHGVAAWVQGAAGWVAGRLPVGYRLRGTGGGQVIKWVCIYGVKVSFWGSGTLKIVIYVENHPQKRSFRLADYHPLWVGGC